AEHLNRSRGAAADPAALCVFSGARASVSQVARALYEEGHRQIGMEDPGSPGLWPALRAAGLAVVPLPVDWDGLITDTLGDHPGMRAICVGAAHQILYARPRTTTSPSVTPTSTTPSSTRPSRSWPTSSPSPPCAPPPPNPRGRGRGARGRGPAHLRGGGMGRAN